jgi:hypothetical protein
MAQNNVTPTTPIIPGSRRGPGGGGVGPGGGGGGGGNAPLSILTSIHQSLKKIETLVKFNSSLLSNQKEQQRRRAITQTRQQQEKQSETPKLVNPLKYLQGALPKTGFLDAIRNFILYTFMGFAFTKLVKFLPKILSTLKFIDPFIKFTENFVGSVFKNFVDAIDLGYEQYDKVRSLAKQVGGEKFEKQFDDLSSALNKFLNTAIIVGLAIAGSGAVGGGGGKKLPTRISPRSGVGGPGGSTRLSQYFSQTRAQEAVTKKYGFDAARLYQDKINKGLTPAKALEAVRERFSPRAIPAAGLAGKGRTSGRIGARGLGKIQQRTSLKLFGKAGTKILGKIPIIGPIADFLISTLIFKERPDRAAAGAVGGAVGAALGSFPALIPFGGPIWGGILGDIVGRSLFDAATSMQGQGEKIQKRASGGTITRGNRSPNRTIKRTISRRKSTLQKPKGQPPQPGKNIGGLKQIKKIFPSPKKSGKKNPLRALKTISEIMNKNRDPLFGGIMMATANLPLGQKPDPLLNQEIKNNFAALIDNAIAAQSAKDVNQIGRSIFTAAQGGVVPVQRTINKNGPTIGQQLGDAISRSFKNALDNRTNQIFQSLRKEMGLKGDGPGVSTPPGGGPGNIIVSSNSPNFWLLATGALFENSDPQGAADVAQVIYNRVSAPGDPWKTNGSMRAAILSPAQFTPVSRYGGVSAWSKIITKEDAIRFATSNGKTQAGLESVAAALLDTNRQRSARTFVGPRDAFRATTHENRLYNQLDDSTEVTRHGHIFGFEPGGAQIAAFKAGKLSPAQVSSQTRGTVTQTGRGGLPLTGENGRLKPSQLTRVGTLADPPDYNDWYGNGAYLRHDAARQFLKAKSDASKQGITLILTSAYRSLEHQRALQGIYSVVGAPGTSQHGEGRALDIRPSTKGWNWFVTNGPNYGWYYAAIPGDDVHFEFRGVVTQTPPQPPAQNPPPQPPAQNPPQPNQPIKNQGVIFKNGKFYKLGPFGFDQEIDVTDRNNTQLRQIPTFGLGRGKEGEIKRAANGVYYKFTGGKWINLHAGGNASIQNNIPSSLVAQAQFTPLPIKNTMDMIQQYDQSSEDQIVNTHLLVVNKIQTA